MRGTRARLPAHGCRQQVLDAVAGNDVVVISGATGCGKSTQVGGHCKQHQQHAHNCH
jgi:HrpA-like RNA helicase